MERHLGDGRLSETTASGSWPRKEEGRGKKISRFREKFFPPKGKRFEPIY